MSECVCVSVVCACVCMGVVCLCVRVRVGCVTSVCSASCRLRSSSCLRFLILAKCAASEFCIQHNTAAAEAVHTVREREAEELREDIARMLLLPARLWVLKELTGRRVKVILAGETRRARVAGALEALVTVRDVKQLPLQCGRMNDARKK